VLLFAIGRQQPQPTTPDDHCSHTRLDPICIVPHLEGIHAALHCRWRRNAVMLANDNKGERFGQTDV
jgi:hypothetical protein